MNDIDEDAVKARREKAYDEVVRLCSGRDRGTWRMSVPADEGRDSDLLIAAALDDIQPLLDRIEELEFKLWEATATEEERNAPMGPIKFPEIQVARGGITYGTDMDRRRR